MKTTVLKVGKNLIQNDFDATDREDGLYVTDSLISRDMLISRVVHEIKKQLNENICIEINIRQTKATDTGFYENSMIMATVEC